MAATVLPTLVGNTLLLIVGVATGTLILGVSLAWLVSTCEFPGRRWFDWALMLPFALPTYVMAFVFLGLLDFQGPVQGLIRQIFDLPTSWNVEVRHSASVLAIMVLVLYPYVYLLARVAFLKQGRAALEAAHTLGMTSWQSFFRVAPADGSPGDHWRGQPGRDGGAGRLWRSCGVQLRHVHDRDLQVMVRLFRPQCRQSTRLPAAHVRVRRAVPRTLRTFPAPRFDDTGSTLDSRTYRLRGFRAAAASAYCGLVLLLAFVIPMVQLLLWANRWTDDLDFAYLSLLSNTLALGAMAAVATTAGGLVLAYALRRDTSWLTRASVRIGTLGYAIPGSVLAVAVMWSLSWVDHRVAEVWLWLTGTEVTWLFVGSVFSLILAYFARFLALAFNPIDSALEQVRPSVREAAQSLGFTGVALVWRIYVPILRPGLLTAALLVLVDVMKEMPATLLLRPFGWDTLAVRIYGLSSEGLWERAALPSVALVAAGLIPVFLLVARGRR